MAFSTAPVAIRVATRSMICWAKDSMSRAGAVGEDGPWARNVADVRAMDQRPRWKVPLVKARLGWLVRAAAAL